LGLVAFSLNLNSPHSSTPIRSGINPGIRARGKDANAGQKIQLFVQNLLTETGRFAPFVAQKSDGIGGGADDGLPNNQQGHPSAIHSQTKPISSISHSFSSLLNLFLLIFRDFLKPQTW
jgi:hypothetical protein